MNTRVAGNRTAMTVITTIFFMWGFITALNDVLIPHLKSVFTLNYTQVMLVQFTFFGAYFLMSLPSGKVLARLGYRLSIVTGLAVTGIGALLFLPAALVQSYPLFLLAFFVLASGITLLQVAANPYVSLLGVPERASSRLNLAQALNSLGTTIAPKLGGLLILSAGVLGSAELAQLPAAQQAAYRLQQAHLVQGPYLVIALVLFALALIVWWFHLPPVMSADEHADDARHTFLDALAQPRVWYGMAAIFVYVGAEVSIGSFMINYISLPGIGNMPEARAAGFVSLYWGGAMVGRFIGSAILTRIDTRKLLAFNAVIAGLLVLATMLTDGHVAMWSVIAIGLFNSVMFPNIFTLGIEKFGPLTSKVSSLLVMAIVGGAVIPLLQGVLADHVGVHHAFVLPLLCYAYIVFYSLKGSRVA
ncbi:MAG TPA: sugar MFS transporter [Rhodanobacteraceae bacterium]|jgi:FHS family L-fucose permease-like MFS transporter|nr:sugar MFS transporter [Rhodanobacteraceae bacterium]